jgi:hypothetical protein
MVIPTLHDIHKSFDIIQVKNEQGKIIYNGIKGEHNLRMIMFTNFVIGQQAIAIFGSKSSGKTNVMKVVGYYCPIPMFMDKSSEKADLRNEDLKKASHIFVPEINKINPNQIEMLKSWGEGEASTYKWFDAMSKATRSMTIPPKAFITSLADENAVKIGDELLSRLTVLSTDSSTGMNEEVIKDKLNNAANPLKKKHVDLTEIENYKMYVISLPSVYDYTFVYPAGAIMHKAIPKVFTDSRRDTDKFLYNTYAITLFHYQDRIKIQKNKKNVMFVTPLDMWYNDIIYHEVLIQSSLKCTRTQKLILDILKEAKKVRINKPYLTINEIHKELIHRNMPISIASIEGHVDSLYKYGYVYKNK